VGGVGGRISERGGVAGWRGVLGRVRVIGVGKEGRKWPVCQGFFRLWCMRVFTGCWGGVLGGAGILLLGCVRGSLVVGLCVALGCAIAV